MLALVASRWSMRFVERVSRFLREHRLASFLISAAVLLVIAEDIVWVLPEARNASLLGWLFVAAMSYSPYAVVVLRRRTPPNIRPFLAWSAALGAAFAGFAAALTGAPVVVMWLGIGLTLALVGWIAWGAEPRGRTG
jgi:hypothetical protein